MQTLQEALDAAAHLAGVGMEKGASTVQSS